MARNFLAGAASQWPFGAIAERSCAGTIECMLEVRETLSGHNSRSSSVRTGN